MVMRPTNFNNSSDNEDWYEGTDGWIGKTRWAVRDRTISSFKWNQISIRYPYEYQKILDGRFKSKWYLFTFTDCEIVCRVQDIKELLLKKRHTEPISNHDGTQAVYINLEDINHLVVSR